MKKKRFDRLIASLEDVRVHVASGPFAGRISEIEVRGAASENPRE
jgi:hypothetical protein